MERQNKKESVAAFHRERILASAQEIFLEKGFSAASIDEISKAAGYSRRTLYAYFDSKEDILHHLILKGLLTLEEELHSAIENHSDFLAQYRAVCADMKSYHAQSPQSFDSVNRAKSPKPDHSTPPQTAALIFAAGTRINALLASYIESGIRRGAVRAGILPLPTVYVLWSGISSLLETAKAKGDFFERQLSMSKDAFLDYGFSQIINSILKEPIEWNPISQA